MFLLQPSRAEINDVGQCVFKLPFTQVIKSCWRQDQLTPKLTCALIWKYALTFLTLHFELCFFCPSLPRIFPLSFAFIFPFSFFLYHHSVPLRSLSFSHYIFYFSCLFLHFTSVFPAPSATPLFRSLRKSHSLIWDMLDLVSLKATLLTPCLPLLRTA